MSGLRDYEDWHRAYDDPNSSLSWRLRTVQRFLREALDRHPGPIRVLSSCSGDGRDLIGVLSQRHDADRVDATLIELHPRIAQRARRAAAAAELAHVTVRTADAGSTGSYEGAVPADLVIMVGILGNISDSDIEQTIKTTPQFCRPGAMLLWSRSPRNGDDRNDAVRSLFIASDFIELDYVSQDTDGDRTGLGAIRYDGEPQPLVTGRQLFTFLR
ncbi:MAG: SAM-dependent methyltransferase [Solirubrobacteraceae bacterium]